MSRNSENRRDVDLREGYNPLKKGFSPTHGNLDSRNPPKVGSGVPRTSTSNNNTSKKSNHSKSSER